MSDTPETDAVQINVEDIPYVTRFFARKLERQRNDARDVASKLHSENAALGCFITKQQHETEALKRDLIKAEMQLDGMVDAEQFRQTKAELTALKSSQMTEERAREVLRGEISKDGKLNGYKIEVNDKGAWFNSIYPYSADQLEAVVWWMRNKGER